jgi:hypothetical protein
LLVARQCLLKRRTDAVVNGIVVETDWSIKQVATNATSGIAILAVTLVAAVTNQAKAKVAGSIANGDFCFAASTATGPVRVEANTIGATALGANATAIIAGRVLAAIVVVIAASLI